MQGWWVREPSRRFETGPTGSEPEPCVQHRWGLRWEGFPSCNHSSPLSQASWYIDRLSRLVQKDRVDLQLLEDGAACLECEVGRDTVFEVRTDTSVLQQQDYITLITAPGRDVRLRVNERLSDPRAWYFTT